MEAGSAGARAAAAQHEERTRHAGRGRRRPDGGGWGREKVRRERKLGFEMDLRVAVVLHESQIVEDEEEKIYRIYIGFAK